MPRVMDVPVPLVASGPWLNTERTDVADPEE
jgi:hypothetical protein